MCELKKLHIMVSSLILHHQYIFKYSLHSKLHFQIFKIKVEPIYSFYESISNNQTDLLLFFKYSLHSNLH
jgi:hypothetical protein